MMSLILAVLALVAQWLSRRLSLILGMIKTEVPGSRPEVANTSRAVPALRPLVVWHGLPGDVLASESRTASDSVVLINAAEPDGRPPVTVTRLYESSAELDQTHWQPPRLSTGDCHAACRSAATRVGSCHVTCRG